MFLDDEALVVSQQQRRHRQGDNHAHNAQQRAPDRERQQDDGSIQSHHLTHNLRSEEGVLNELDNTEHDDHHQHDKPEVLSGVGCLDNSQQDGRDEANQLEVGHHIEQSDEHAQTNSHREVDDKEPDAEQDTYAEGYDALTTEILVHTFFDVGNQFYGHVTITRRQEVRPALCKLLVVDENE